MEKRSPVSQPVLSSFFFNSGYKILKTGSPSETCNIDYFKLLWQWVIYLSFITLTSTVCKVMPKTL